MSIRSFRLGTLGFVLTAACVGHFIIPLSAIAATNDAILEENAVLESSYREHNFTGRADQTVRITVKSDDLSLSLWNFTTEDGEYVSYFPLEATTYSETPQFLAVLPSSGRYTLSVQTYDPSQSGDYSVMVEVATPYESALAKGLSLQQSGEYEDAIEAFDQAIELDGDRPEAYKARGDALYGLAQQLRPEEREAIVNSYQQAVDLYESSGNTEAAEYLRSQIMYLQSDNPMMPY